MEFPGILLIIFSNTTCSYALLGADPGNSLRGLKTARAEALVGCPGGLSPPEAHRIWAKTYFNLHPKIPISRLMFGSQVKKPVKIDFAKKYGNIHHSLEQVLVIHISSSCKGHYTIWLLIMLDFRPKTKPIEHIQSKKYFEKKWRMYLQMVTNFHTIYILDKLFLDFVSFCVITIPFISLCI